MYIGDWLGRREQLSPHKVALIDAANEWQPISYRAWNRAANRTAHLLRNRGIGKGDRVAVLAHNCVAYLDLWFACGKLGAIFQPLNWRLATRELAALIDDAAPLALVYGPDFVAQIEALRSQAASVRHWIALDPQARAASDDTTLAERTGMPDTPPPAIDLRWDDPWALCYTGGTTGTPKGAILTHGNVAWNAINTITSWGVTPDDVTILNAPLFHTGGLNVLTAPLVQIGGTSIVCRSFDPDQVFDLLDESRVSLLFGVPTMFIALQAHPRWRRTNLTRLKLVISGGAPCPQPVFERFWERGVHFKTGYGLTEAGPNTFWLPAEDVQRKAGSVGFPLFYIDTRVVDEQGRTCAADEVGELEVRGPHVTTGYWNRPADTMEAIVDGWLRTGDLARTDAEGYYYIVGRRKDMLISGGENIYPAEVENVLAAHPAVAEVALIGMPDPQWGEVGRAYVVLRQGQSPDADALVAFARERLARFKVPRSVVFVDELPKTGAGKLDKQRLRQLALGGAAPETVGEEAQGGSHDRRERH